MEIPIVFHPPTESYLQFNNILFFVSMAIVALQRDNELKDKI